MATALVGSLIALSCTDERQEGPTEPPSAAASPKLCPSDDPNGIQQQICALFPANDLLKSASDFYNNVKTKLRSNTPKDLAVAQSRAADLVTFTIKQFYALKLNGGSSPGTQGAVLELSCDVFDLVTEPNTPNTPCPISSTDLSTGQGPHSAFQACGPEGCLVLPPDKHSGVSVPRGALLGLAFIKVTPVAEPFPFPPRSGPLQTPKDQYRLFREYELFGFDEFEEEVLVGICQLNEDDGDFAPPPGVWSRLKLAHPHPDIPETIEELDRKAAPFLDCSDLNSSNDEIPQDEGEGLQGQIGAAGRAIGRTLAPVLLSLLPEPAEAAVLGECCLGGSTRKFSPFAAVDPLSGPNILSGVNSSDDGFSFIDAASGEVTFIGRLDPNTSLYTTPVALAVQPSDQTVYVWNNSGDGTNASAGTGVLLTVNTSTGRGTRVNTSTPPQGPIGALAFSTAGALYGIADRGEQPEEGPAIIVSDLVSVNPATGVKTLIGALGSGLRVGGADFSCSDVLYGVELNAAGPDRLVTINTSTGEATTVATLSQEIGTIGSIVFTTSGTLIGSSSGPSGSILFNINPANGTVSNIQPISGGSTPQGLGVTRTCPVGPS